MDVQLKVVWLWVQWLANLLTKICNLAAVYVWNVGLDGLWNCSMSPAIWKPEEWMSEVVLSMTIQVHKFQVETSCYLLLSIITVVNN